MDEQKLRNWSAGFASHLSSKGKPDAGAKLTDAMQIADAGKEYDESLAPEDKLGTALGLQGGIFGSSPVPLKVEVNGTEVPITIQVPNLFVVVGLFIGGSMSLGG